MSGENINIPKDMLKMVKELMDMGAVGFGGFVDDDGNMYPITLGQMPNFAKAPNVNSKTEMKKNYNNVEKPFFGCDCGCDGDCNCNDEEYHSCDCEHCDFDCGGCDCGDYYPENDEEFDCDETVAQTPVHSLPLNAYVLDNGTYSLRFNCGNFAKEDIEISYNENTVTVTAVRTEVQKLPEGASFSTIKRVITEEFKSVEKASRSITLTEPDFKKAVAEFKNGVLTIKVPQKAKPEPSKITIM